MMDPIAWINAKRLFRQVPQQGAVRVVHGDGMEFLEPFHVWGATCMLFGTRSPAAGDHEGLAKITGVPGVGGPQVPVCLLLNTYPGSRGVLGQDGLGAYDEIVFAEFVGPDWLWKDPASLVYPLASGVHKVLLGNLVLSEEIPTRWGRDLARMDKHHVPGTLVRCDRGIFSAHVPGTMSVQVSQPVLGSTLSAGPGLAHAIGLVDLGKMLAYPTRLPFLARRDGVITQSLAHMAVGIPHVRVLEPDDVRVINMGSGGLFSGVRDKSTTWRIALMAGMAMMVTLQEGDGDWWVRIPGA